MKTKFAAFLFLLICGAAHAVFAQAKNKYNYAAQKNFIPAELGRIYLGMPLKAFAQTVNLKEAEADTRFNYAALKIPFAKGGIISLNVKIHGLSDADKAQIFHKETVKRKDESGAEFNEEVEKTDASKIPASGFIYEIGIAFKDNFDLKSYALKKFGKPTDQNAKGIYDLQWTRKTADGLTWIIRYHAESKALQLIGVINGTEWDPKA